MRANQLWLITLSLLMACTSGGSAASSGAGGDNAGGDSAAYKGDAGSSRPPQDAAVSGKEDARVADEPDKRKDAGSVSASDAGQKGGGPVVGADQGGTVTGESSTVTIPKGALTSDTHITIDPGTQIATPDEWRFAAAGPPVRLGPSGTQFSMPVTVTLTFDPAAVDGRTDLLVVAHRDDRTGHVQFLRPNGVNGNHVSVPTSSFSTFQASVLTELMAGVVRDRNTSLPVDGAKVFFYGSGYGTATTNANGAYSFTIETLTSFGGALHGTLYAGADGYFEAPSISVSDLGAQPALPVVNDVTLLPNGPLVHGVITDAVSGLPVAGAAISFSRNPMSTFRGGATTVSVNSASDGSYAVDASYFAENVDNAYSVNLMINAAGYLGMSKSVSLNGTGHMESFALISSTGPLMTGVVRDRTSQAPIAGAKVFFYGSGHGTVTTDANGAYTFTGADLSSFGGGLSGTLYVGADGYFEAPSVAISDLASQQTLPVVRDVTLRSSGPVASGTVTNANTGDPIENATISFSRNPMSTFRGGATTVSVLTASDGSYAVDPAYFVENDDDEYSINFMVNANGYLGSTRNVSISALPHTVNFALPSSSGSLMAGTVTHRQSHAPIPGAKVFFYGSGYGTVTADLNGEYSFTAADISFFGGGLSGTLYVGADGYFEGPSVPIMDLSLEPSLPVENDVSLLPSGPLVTGVVTDATSSNPIAAATVSFNRNPMSTFRGGATTASVMTANDGSYTIDASYFAESMSGYSANLMINAQGYLGATRNVDITTFPQTESFALTPGSSAP